MPPRVVLIGSAVAGLSLLTALDAAVKAGLLLGVAALVVLLGMRLQTPLLFEAALVIAMLGFVSTVGLARYLSRGDVVE